MSDRSVELVRGGFEQTKERRTRLPGAGFEFRMELDADVVRVVVQFENLAALPRFVFTDKDQPGSVSYTHLTLPTKSGV